MVLFNLIIVRLQIAGNFFDAFYSVLLSTIVFGFVALLHTCQFCKFRILFCNNASSFSCFA